MSSAVFQALTLAIGGVLVLALTLTLTRRGHLSLHFGVGWLAVSGVVLVAAALGGLHVFVRIASWLHLSPTGLIAAGIGTFLLSVCLQLSVALSRTQMATRTLLQRVALLDERLRRLERESSPDRVDDVVTGRRS